MIHLTEPSPKKKPFTEKRREKDEKE